MKRISTLVNTFCYGIVFPSLSICCLQAGEVSIEIPKNATLKLSQCGFNNPLVIFDSNRNVVNKLTEEKQSQSLKAGEYAIIGSAISGTTQPFYYDICIEFAPDCSYWFHLSGTKEGNDIKVSKEFWMGQKEGKTKIRTGTTISISLN